MNGAEKTGRIRLSVWGKTYSATWRVDGLRVFVQSSIGDGSAPLGGLASAPAIVAGERFKEIIKTANGPTKPPADQKRFDVQDGGWPPKR